MVDDEHRRSGHLGHLDEDGGEEVHLGVGVLVEEVAADEGVDDEDVDLAGDHAGDQRVAVGGGEAGGIVRAQSEPPGAARGGEEPPAAWSPRSAITASARRTSAGDLLLRLFEGEQPDAQGLEDARAEQGTA